MANNLDSEKFYIEFRKRISDSSNRDYRFSITKSFYQKIVQTSESELSFEFVIDRDILYFELQYAELILWPPSQSGYTHVQLSCVSPNGVSRLPGPIGKGQILHVTAIKT